MTPVLQIFAKAPVPGECKTRLIPVLGPNGAAKLHERLVRHRLDAARLWRDAVPGARVELWCASDPDHPFFADCVRDYGIALQVQFGADLGGRMWVALCGAIAKGERPVLVGSDCPWLTVADIVAAHAALDETDAVFSPAHDGGYVQVGLKRAIPGLFAGIAWGTDRVMSETRAAARRGGVSLAELRSLHDLDVPADLERLKGEARLSPLLEGLLR